MLSKLFAVYVRYYHRRQSQILWNKSTVCSNISKHITMLAMQKLTVRIYHCTSYILLGWEWLYTYIFQDMCLLHLIDTLIFMQHSSYQCTEQNIFEIKWTYMAEMQMCMRCVTAQIVKLNQINETFKNSFWNSLFSTVFSVIHSTLELHVYCELIVQICTCTLYFTYI